MQNLTQPETTFIAPFSHLSNADLERAGGKGANLGELVRAGFPVPAGFVVTTAAYERFVLQHQLDQLVDRVIREQRSSSAEMGGTEIRAAFERAEIPGEIEQGILAAYTSLGQGPVAVRSSATAEDLPGAAFAGQQETFLNIIGEAALLDAIRRCWASLWGDRAIAYRERLALDQRAVKLAVVVQTMVPADFAGVLFTANPVTGARDEIALDANPGLGEAVVSGLVTPDHYILCQRAGRQRSGWKVVERRPGRREMMIRARAGGGTEQLEGAAAVLPEPALYQLAQLGAAIQRHFGRPQDIEWAWADNQPFILQARPMTALPEPLPHINLPQRLLASNFGEMIPTRPYPLDLDTWLPALSSAVDPIFTVLGLEWRLGQMFEIEDGTVIRFKSELPHPTWRVLLAPVRLISLGLRYHPLQWQADPLLAEAQVNARALEARDPSKLTWAELLETVYAARAIPQQAAGEIRRRYFPGAVFAVARLRLMLSLLGQTEKFLVLLSGPENKTVQANQAIEQLAARVRADVDLAQLFATHAPQQLWAALADQPTRRAFLEDLRAFLALYGHRETTISTALHPTWKDAPEVVLGMIKGFATHPPQLPAGQPAWQAARDELLQHRLLHFAPLRSAFLKTLTEARTLLQIREDTHFYATLALPIFRRTLLQFGQRLTKAGILGAPKDVFYLTLGELEQIGASSDREPSVPPEQAADLRPAVLCRKQARDRLEGTPLVDPRLYPHDLPTGDALLRGMPGSPGVVEGPARIVRDTSEFERLAAGEVLVAPYTNPSWTPLFQRAIAVIVDSGSAASHAAIVAREYGIPAVMSTISGTQTLHDGDRIRVDGNQGLVFRVALPLEEETAQQQPG